VEVKTRTVGVDKFGKGVESVNILQTAKAPARGKNVFFCGTQNA